MSKDMHSKDLLIALVAGGVLGAITAFFTAPKAGCRLRQDVCDLYDDMSGRTQDVANTIAKKSRCAIKNVSGQTSDWIDKAKCIIDDVREWVGPDAHESHLKNWIIGGAIGVAVGAAAGLLLAPKAGNVLRQDLLDTYEDVNERTHDLLRM